MKLQNELGINKEQKRFFSFLQRMNELKGSMGGRRRPIGIRVHLTGNQEMGMEAECDGGEMRDGGTLRHMMVVMAEVVAARIYRAKC